MRSGGYMVQQALTPEAATILKQALTLSKRRGHAQVTPLHVAHTMLSSPTGLFRTACLQSHSHPLQCKALELCFNVALNRLPTSSSNPVFGSHTLSHPSISNALVAAFKRAQAHQRRGSIESQQQPLLAVKIELEQLIISILDDPSVSRVMREARFSSTQVKINVEKAVSLELCSQTITTQNKNPKEFYPLASSQSPCSSQELGRLEGKPKELYQTREEDVCFVINNMLQNRRRNIVIVGECVDTLEGLVRDLMGKVDKGDVHESFKEVKFLTLPILHLNLSREEVEQKLVELKSIVTRYIEKGVVLYLGDLKWISEYRADSSCDQGRGMGQYCHVDYLVMEIGKLGCSIEENNSFWIMGIACFKTYMNCKSGNSPLESILRLHPITIPERNLSLCLNHESDIEIGLADKQLKSYSETGTSILRRSISSSQLTTSSLPLWLQKYKDENNIHQGCVLSDLCETPISNTSVSPSCSTNSFLYDHLNFNYEPRFRSYTNSCSKGLEQALPPYQSSPANSSSSSCLMEVKYINNFKELNYENFDILCTSLEQQVPFQRDIVPEIVTTILQSRSRRKQVNGEIRNKETNETWMCFQGIDMDAKEKIARELARLIFGSSRNFVSIISSSFSCSRYHTNGELRNKRSRDHQCGSYLKVFSEAVFCDPHRVFFLDNIEYVDHDSQLGIKKATESGSLRDSNGKEVSLQDAIIILSCKNFDSNSRTYSPHIKPKLDNVEKEKAVSLDLNISLEDTESEDEPFDDIGLLKCVEGRIIFKAHVH